MLVASPGAPAGHHVEIGQVTQSLHRHTANLQRGPKICNASFDFKSILGVNLLKSRLGAADNPGKTGDLESSPGEDCPAGSLSAGEPREGSPRIDSSGALSCNVLVSELTLLKDSESQLALNLSAGPLSTSPLGAGISNALSHPRLCRHRAHGDMAS